MYDDPGMREFLFKDLGDLQLFISQRLNLPKTLSPMIQGYMRTEFFYSTHTIALWNPSPSLSFPSNRRRRNIQLGDVGYFNKDGGFDVLFNIFLDTKGNCDLEFDLPPEFEPYVIPRGLVMKKKDYISEDQYDRSPGAFTREKNSVGYV